MATTGRADIIGTVPTIYARDIIKYTQPNLEAWKRINTRMLDSANVGDRVQVATYQDTQSTPNAAGSAAVQLATGVAPFSGVAEADPLTATYADQTIGSTTIYISNWYYVASELSAYAQAVKQGDVLGLFKQAGLDSLAAQIDTSVWSLITGLTSNAAIGTLGTALTDDLILDGKTNLDNGNVPKSDRNYVFSPSEENNYLKLDKYVNALTRGNTQPVTKGEIGNLYGMSWASTTQVPSPGAGQHRNVMFHRDAWAGRMLKAPVARMADSPDPGLATRILAMAIWGVGEVRDRFGQEMRGV
jgi:hypothetical protein